MIHVPGELIPIVLFLSVPITIIGGTMARAWARRVDRGAVAPRDLSGIDARLTRIEQSVDAIAIEMERVSEGQRFLTRVMGERKELGAPPDAGTRS
ncbi:MAG: hypothetical protein M3068_14010 [Gemmatimonadota bacterium]|nr:hypothetical protein [Gemmatimonadota bacterium]